MRKLRLELNELEVETFATGALGAALGTVEAHVSCRCTNAEGGTCGGGASCNGGETCDANCSGVTYVESCPCGPGGNTVAVSCNSPSCVYTCTCNWADNC